MINFERVTSTENSLIKSAAHLVASSKYRKETNSFVLDGLRLCRDAAINGFPIDCFIVSETAYEKNTADADFLSERASKSIIVTDRIISKISDTVNPQGFICICKKKENDESCISANGLYIGLENVSDPSNLGAISRTAEAFGFNALIVTDSGCDPYNSKALRASMGALLRLPVIIVNDMKDFLKKSGLVSYACVVDKEAESIRKINFNPGSIAVIGNEANGLLEETVAACNKAVTIPMNGKAESLNASMAAGIVMWEMLCHL